ncbi:precorrin-6Y C5,15-methyltransferase (decarboxylating) subunit CbiT [Methanococcus aeolicus]|nr:precorrin-6Y C5,15-methyltransferase (decarboxylating) subunit CbiT [Methanococcus aeolicus]UXM84564.1 precorrin-6Y C5,15-methyltransferase (decarboxylating) subunit CbiT [Methanococcus aeolicus]
MIKDNDFFRMDGVPITKEEIRAVSIGKLQLKPNDVVVDIGCGSGGMTVEIAKRCKFVYAIDGSDNAINTTKKNLERFNIKNCEIINEDAENILLNLDFNKAFIGGTKNIEKILNILSEKNIGHIVSNTIVIDNAVKIINILDNKKYDTELLNISVSVGKKIGAGHMMIAKNPITIITARL